MSSKRWLGIGALCAWAAAGSAHADPAPSNRTINIQGVLRDGSGALQSNGFGVDVALYTTATGGTAFYTQHLNPVAVQNGYFSIELAGDQLGFSSADAWAEVWIAGDKGPLPRQHLAAVPYAFSCVWSNDSANLGGKAPSYYVDSASNQSIAGTKTFTGTIDGRGDVNLFGASAALTINVRSFVNIATATGFCGTGGGQAIYTPRSWVGRSGNDICAADKPSNGQTHTKCVGIKNVWVAADNTAGTYTDNRTCDQPLANPWPWGLDDPDPDSLPSEWGHGSTQVVCCK